MNVTFGPWVISTAHGRAVTTQRGTIGNAWEPTALGLYRDRDGDLWEKEAGGWRLRLQDGVPVDPDALWDWADGCVRDYAPFVPCR
ncbi:hypothetical protein ACFYUD_26160 [Nocardia tengchongensis]|uniref:hypothetical protein n=1 Tax=Nocardia tengchongensis TaxID=2055889 RepID=UPI003691AC13